MSMEFTLGQPVNLEEDERVEFKEILGGNPVKSIINTSDEYVVAFLNAGGGSIHWGIRDCDRIVVGVQLTSNDKDSIRKGIAQKLHGIQPAIDPTAWMLEFVLLNADKEGDSLFAVSVIVQNREKGVPYYTAGGDCFVRMNGVKQKLCGPALTEYLRSRLTAPVQAHVGADSISDPKITGLAQRVRKVFLEHGLEYSHLPRFLALP